MNHKNLLAILCCIVAALGFSGCYNDFDEADTKGYTVTATGIAEPNTTIYAVKAKYCANSSAAGTSANSSNFWTLVEADEIFEGVVVANDISGNLYQSVFLRELRPEAATEAERDQVLMLGIKSSCLYPYFKLGQRVRVNLKGLYVGVYSKAPKVGTPYFTSAGNNRLGPMLFDALRTNVQLIGEPNPDAPELQPIDLTDAKGQAWIKDSSNQTWQNCPILATVEGKMKEVQGMAAKNPEAGTEDTWEGVYEDIITFTNADGTTQYSKIYAPECLRDAGYCVDRTIQLANGSAVTLRTGTGNRISFLVMPFDSRKYTGMLTYYSGWQTVLRDADDIYPQIDPTIGTPDF